MSNLIIRRSHPLSVLNEMDRMIDSFFGDFSSSGLRTPAVDISEDDRQYNLVAEVPGLSEDDVEIKVDGQLLTISSKKTDEKETADKGGFVLRERRHSSFARSFSLPSDVDVEHIEASASRGVLTVVIPKVPKAQPKTIAIKSV